MNQKGKLDKIRKDSKGGEEFTQYVKDHIDNGGLMNI